MSSSSSATRVSKDLPRLYRYAVKGLLLDFGISASFPDQYHLKDSYALLLRHFLKIHHLHPGRISCVFTVVPSLVNAYNGLLGGAVRAIAERMAIACARTVCWRIEDVLSLCWAAKRGVGSRRVGGEKWKEYNCPLPSYEISVSVSYPMASFTLPCDQRRDDVVIDYRSHEDMALTNASASASNGCDVEKIFSGFSIGTRMNYNLSLNLSNNSIPL